MDLLARSPDATAEDQFVPLSLTGEKEPLHLPKKLLSRAVLQLCYSLGPQVLGAIRPITH